MMDRGLELKRGRVGEGPRKRGTSYWQILYLFYSFLGNVHRSRKWSRDVYK